MNKIQELTSSLGNIPADGSMSAVITAFVIDSDTQTPLQDITVTWSVEGGTAGPASSITDENGNAVTNVAATGEGVITIKATTEDDQEGVTLKVQASKALPAPNVLNATEEDQYTIDYYDIAFGVTAIVPVYPNASANHVIEFFWGDIHEKFAVVDPDKDLPKIIHINDLGETALMDGSHPVYYIVTDAAGNESISSAVPVVVKNGGQTSETLAGPSIPVAEDGFINIKDSLNGVEVEISYADMAVGDSGTLYWNALDIKGNKITGGSTSISFVVTEENIDSVVLVTIDSAFFYPNGGKGYEGTVDAYYTVTKESQDLLLSFTTHCRVDTVSP
ncbi:Ig-like domain-containing protein [Providencia alcalifaciens]|uniref:Ig-like domain-containing protein n=1 Tax=Providencia alcalifaciens TaxID=126385 RepID=UPI001CC4A543|nr:Ig-like domain-containing protein [Providencia alcalifaciens]CAG9436627.1 hypothetical protein NVI2019_KOLGMIGM_04051 [Providencia alcalifaciens]CAG9436641.1 hypothetical protein NVI2019_PLFLNFOB_04049 [Providencia alcalifaciens]CAG9436663.1 hypothetical protein NVI2019_ANGEOOBF_04050 [Providencia alcalifaciens]CAG9436931.1 hypothetical protein NVI2019_OGMBKCAO_04120 [Providencia alcalifaciens]CAG9437559.1 hypothetical protein NVI2019_OHEONHNH_04049 [Providencia alcalifaciens]